MNLRKSKEGCSGSFRLKKRKGILYYFKNEENYNKKQRNA